MAAGFLAALILTLSLTQAVAQGLPVRIHKDIKAFNGSPAAVIAVTEEPARYTLVSAHKEAGRPWADALIRRETTTGRTILSRAYDCAAGTYRNLGEGRNFRQMTNSVTPTQIQDRVLEPGTIEYTLARYVCAL